MVNLVLSFIVNFIILSTFLHLVNAFYPLGGVMLYQVFHVVGLAYTATHVIYLYSFVAMVIMCILAKTPIAEQLACFSLGCRVPQGAHQVVLDRAMAIVCGQAGLSREDFRLHEILVP